MHAQRRFCSSARASLRAARFPQLPSLLLAANAGTAEGCGPSTGRSGTASSLWCKKGKREETSLNGEHIRKDTTTTLLSQTYGIACTVKVEYPSEGRLSAVALTTWLTAGCQPRDISNGFFGEWRSIVELIALERPHDYSTEF